MKRNVEMKIKACNRFLFFSDISLIGITCFLAYETRLQINTTKNIKVTAESNYFQVPYKESFNTNLLQK